MLNCTRGILAAHPRAAGRRAGGGAVVLWATDMDRYAAPLLREMAALDAVTVVRLVAPHAERFDRHPETALADLVLLSQADRLVATAMSTFSYAAHARGLAAPHHPTFRDPAVVKWWSK
jgi:hypothetical protein